MQILLKYHWLSYCSISGDGTNDDNHLETELASPGSWDQTGKEGTA